MSELRTRPFSLENLHLLSEGENSEAVRLRVWKNTP